MVNILWLLVICFIVLLVALGVLIAIYIHVRKDQPSEQPQKITGLYIIHDDPIGDLLKVAASFYLIAATTLMSIVSLILAAIAFLLLPGGIDLLEALKMLREMLP